MADDVAMGHAVKYANVVFVQPLVHYLYVLGEGGPILRASGIF